MNTSKFSTSPKGSTLTSCLKITRLHKLVLSFVVSLIQQLLLLFIIISGFAGACATRGGNCGCIKWPSQHVWNGVCQHWVTDKASVCNVFRCLYIKDVAQLIAYKVSVSCFAILFLAPLSLEWCNRFNRVL